MTAKKSKTLIVTQGELCKFILIGQDDDGLFLFTCGVCNRKPIRSRINNPDKIYAICVGKKTIFAKAARYGKEFLNWVMNGSRFRSKSEIEEIYSTYCKPCPNFQPTKTGGVCSKCSCRLGKERSVLNKIAMNSTHCPVGKW